ncbi:hypothetical protein KR054_002019, partial [Drosophila jambulina]
MLVVQINLNHCASAHDLLAQAVQECGAVLVAISEPYGVYVGPNWVTDSSGKAALWSCGSAPKRWTDVLPERGFVRAKTGDWWIYSVYLAPSLSLSEFEEAIDRLAADARGRVPAMTVDDFNAWTVEWVSSLTNARDRAFLGAFSSLEVTLLNYGTAAGLRRLVATGSAEQMAESVMSQLQASGDDCMLPKQAHTRNREPVYWWNQRLAEARGECNKARRLYEHSYRTSAHTERKAEFQGCREALKV